MLTFRLAAGENHKSRLSCGRSLNDCCIQRRSSIRLRSDLKVQRGVLTRPWSRLEADLEVPLSSSLTSPIFCSIKLVRELTRKLRRISEILWRFLVRWIEILWREQSLDRRNPTEHNTSVKCFLYSRKAIESGPYPSFYYPFDWLMIT